MTKKIMIICGSPRNNGNTMTIANWVASGAREEGGKVEIVDAARLQYRVNGCTACMGCQKSDQFRCVIEDEASTILARMPEQDVLVFATPVYFMGFSAQIKLILDRMFSLFKIKGDGYRIAPGLEKTSFALIASGSGDENGGLKLVEENMNAIADFIKKESKSFLVPLAPMETGAIDSNPGLKAKAVEFGAELTK